MRALLKKTQIKRITSNLYLDNIKKYRDALNQGYIPCIQSVSFILRLKKADDPYYYQK